MQLSRHSIRIPAPTARFLQSALRFLRPPLHRTKEMERFRDSPNSGSFCAVRWSAATAQKFARCARTVRQPDSPPTNHSDGAGYGTIFAGMELIPFPWTEDYRWTGDHFSQACWDWPQQVLRRQVSGPATPMRAYRMRGTASSTSSMHREISRRRHNRSTIAMAIGAASLGVAATADGTTAGGGDGVAMAGIGAGAVSAGTTGIAAAGAIGATVAGYGFAAGNGTRFSWAFTPPRGRGVVAAPFAAKISARWLR